MANNPSGRSLLELIRSPVNLKNRELITDEFRAYNLMGQHIKHAVVKRRKGQYVNGDAHTNTIEGFWSFIKQAWYGQHHPYQTGYTPLYVAEVCD